MDILVLTIKFINRALMEVFQLTLEIDFVPYMVPSAPACVNASVFSKKQYLDDFKNESIIQRPWQLLL